MKLLIVEDEARMAELLRKGLTEEGHSAVCAFDGAEGLALAKGFEFDVIILDIMLPKLSGYEMAKRLRSEKIRTPLLMLTAKDSVPDIVRGLDLGADDYMTKPFSFEELLARLRAVQRRAMAAAGFQPAGRRPGAGAFQSRGFARPSPHFPYAHGIQFAGAAGLPHGQGGCPPGADRSRVGF